MELPTTTLRSESAWGAPPKKNPDGNRFVVGKKKTIAYAADCF